MGEVGFVGGEVEVFSGLGRLIILRVLFSVLWLRDFRTTTKLV